MPSGFLTWAQSPELSPAASQRLDGEQSSQDLIPSTLLKHGRRPNSGLTLCHKACFKHLNSVWPCEKQNSTNLWNCNEWELERSIESINYGNQVIGWSKTVTEGVMNSNTKEQSQKLPSVCNITYKSRSAPFVFLGTRCTEPILTKIFSIRFREKYIDSIWKFLSLLSLPHFPPLLSSPFPLSLPLPHLFFSFLKNLFIWKA